MNCEHPVVVFNRGAETFLRSGACKIHSSYESFIMPFLASSQWSFNYETCLNIFNRLAHRVDINSINDHYITTGCGVILLFIAVPCGKCSLCRDSRVHEWQTRCTLESAAHTHNPTMLTLTYTPDKRPPDGVNQLDIKRFLARLRVNLKRHLNFDPKYKLRYILASEYGSDEEYIDSHGRKRKGTQHPHYHMLVWGFPNQAFQNPFNPKSELNELWQGIIFSSWGNCIRKCFQCETARDASGRYVAKYISKKSKVPKGQNPTFFNSSKHPAIGWASYARYVLPYVISNPTSPIYMFPLHGKIKDLTIPSYFLVKTFKPYSSYIPLKFRSNLKILNQYLHVFQEINRNFYKLYPRFYNRAMRIIQRSVFIPRELDFLSKEYRDKRYYSERELYLFENPRLFGSILGRCEVALYWVEKYLRFHPRLQLDELRDMISLRKTKCEFSNAHNSQSLWSEQQIQDSLVRLHIRQNKEKSRDKSLFYDAFVDSFCKPTLSV